MIRPKSKNSNFETKTVITSPSPGVAVGISRGSSGSPALGATLGRDPEKGEMSMKTNCIVHIQIFILLSFITERFECNFFQSKCLIMHSI